MSGEDGCQQRYLLGDFQLTIEGVFQSGQGFYSRDPYWYNYTQG